ncbi:MAG TPA: hypothetical protein VD788_12840 [Candidatus Polarisedimenticolaceae bacterium]|nr:hypothetical protein [Candidatus Polarisedimenticolaceae bacterium]
MWKRIGIAAGLSLVGAAIVFIAGCEDTDVTAPQDSTITVVASPAAITINQETGQTRGSTTIIAQLLSASGIPQSGVPLFFTSTGGLMGSVDNQCSAGNCVMTGESCTLDGDCRAISPTSIETDSNGIATDILTLRLAEDPASVDVTVQSTVSATTVSVATNVSAGPQAQISASPTNGARTGQPITFTAATQSGVVITCYEWTIASSLSGVPDELIFRTTPTLAKRYGDTYSRSAEQDLQVRLRVSGQTGACGASLPFSQFEDSITYLIRCDFTDPSVDAGPNITRSLANDQNVDGDVVVALTATAFDEEDAELTYQWDCMTGASPPPGATAECKYNTEGTFAPRVRVTNRCGRFVEGNLTVQINP